MSLESAAEKTKTAEILVLDDEPSIAEMLCEMLDMLGHKATLCLSGTEALAMIDKRKFDVVLSDFRMPIMNGQEFYHCVSEKDSSLASRIIFLTGDSMNEETQKFLKSTGNSHLAKPFQFTDLQRAVGEMLSSPGRES